MPLRSRLATFLGVGAFLLGQERRRYPEE
jgi:hypothetical protein